MEINQQKSFYLVVQLQQQPPGIQSTLVDARNGNIVSDFRCYEGGWLEQFEGWCRSQQLSATVVTLSDWDLKTMLPKYLEDNKIKLSSYLHRLFRSWTNVKTSFCIAMKAKHTSLEGMVDYFKIAESGRGAIVDVCKELTRRGCDLTTTTTRWTPNSLWYEWSRFSSSSGNITRIN
jgi:hypothetical protein